MWIPSFIKILVPLTIAIIGVIGHPTDGPFLIHVNACWCEDVILDVVYLFDTTSPFAASIAQGGEDNIFNSIVEHNAVYHSNSRFGMSFIGGDVCYKHIAKLAHQRSKVYETIKQFQKSSTPSEQGIIPSLLLATTDKSHNWTMGKGQGRVKFLVLFTDQPLTQMEKQGTPVKGDGTDDCKQMQTPSHNLVFKIISKYRTLVFPIFPNAKMLEDWKALLKGKDVIVAGGHLQMDRPSLMKAMKKVILKEGIEW